jgi:hypothetical protein
LEDAKKEIPAILAHVESRRGKGTENSEEFILCLYMLLDNVDECIKHQVTTLKASECWPQRT